ncbi:xanthine dehydrogenase family protein molybdopterin-binding subunit [Paraburkholderia lycopersici]|uniref:CO or xanthine dehydrogenase, Mo-binding subunit n=1 Tax=Paraburkholderia lycopersici TaxID=416944 RepID=A0A1G7ARW7_9BURK|nr:molybdopterin cofactor-binding domain-containing protein [Paraburkholderia lycopersici]SDE17287.1 CO or xanthine dehydrogenase, Mo-binding subunit [Paraburkholderia lycopersici]
MACDRPITRRTFLKAVGSGAFTVSVSSITALTASCSSQRASVRSDERAAATHAAPEFATGAPDWAPEPGKARWRIEGVRKVTGAKIYARDYKARDFDGWPKEENWLYALRCNCVDKTVEGFDLSVLPRHLRPISVVSNQTLNDNRVYLATKQDPLKNKDIYLFAQEGNPADCYGQPVALLIFEDFDTYRRAKTLLDFNETTIRYGATVSRDKNPPTLFSAPKLYVRDDDKSFSNIHMETDKSGNPTDAFKSRCRALGDEIRALAAQRVTSHAWHAFNGTFQTPAIDPMFMEPEAGLAWYQAESGVLQMVLGTQSPRDDASSAGSLFTNSKIRITHVHVQGCYPGGGFGGRDKSYFPLYLALAAPFAKGALRWQQSRYEQFQVGLKRSETAFTESIWLDDDGKLQALDSTFRLNGGGKANLTGAVGDLAAMSAMSCYDIPRAIAQSSVTYTPEVFGGSQRGFGGPQAFLAIETLMDEAAQSLHRSPFDIRRGNLLVKGRGKTVTGAPILFDLQLEELLGRLETHALWRDRERTRAQRHRHGLRYGVGLAMSNQAYGTGKDAVFAMVQIQPDASLRVLTHYADMGNGAATTLGLAPATWLGQNAREIVMSEVEAFTSITDFDYRLLGKWPDDDRSYSISGPFGSSSACLGAFHHFQAVDRAAMALMLQSALPAAREIWGNPRIELHDLKWTNGKLTAAGRSPIIWTALLDRINRMQLPVVAAVHVTYAGGFWRSKYTFKSGPADMDCDFVAVGPDTNTLKSLPHGELISPHDAVGYGRTNYAPAAALVAVAVNPDSGRVKVEHVVTTLSAGRIICREIVEGQSQGAVAMAIGNVLSESCPLGDRGPGNGKWNLDQYLITQMTDVPSQELVTLPPPAEKERHSARGIGEAVMCPIAPALLNALAMATGHRFRQTPVTPDQIREALK